MFQRKKAKISHEKHDLFDRLPDDIVISILCSLSSSARSPADLISILLTCKRLNSLRLDPMVLSRAGSGTFRIRAKNWCENAHRFVKLCVSAGNVEATYTLGMIRFYCLQNRGSGASLMAKAAIRSHAPALYSLAVIQFNGSGGLKKWKESKDLRAGVALCARAAYLGHVDALRELGHCLQDGYGVARNVTQGHRLLVQANARELASALRSAPAHHVLAWQLQNLRNGIPKSDPGWDVKCSLLSDLDCHVVAREIHPANRFLTEWFVGGPGSDPDLRLCSHAGCGRPETRRNEFRRCSACGAVNYCSRGCQAQDWKVRHKAQCASMERLINPGAVDGEDGDDLMAEVEGVAAGAL
ncbi:HCP-like superfamily protein with MYND-type zinc finger [Actinidia rufa]|uniref:HCP-like superfamily protein with MYND-type zinc finger n=1 Tax=Actinidia rufa TaxID=165716 RepID=A0A7J0GAS7_9ERIC|nr:HCP-like superfamily protein with MYND-type zinc finger [Actinidia rufa]GFZ07900.1 HCP-like superfamily protein with MYND-type zinc finger [Actinidia rufa]